MELLGKHIIFRFRSRFLRPYPVNFFKTPLEKQFYGRTVSEVICVFNAIEQSRASGSKKTRGREPGRTCLSQRQRGIPGFPGKGRRARWAAVYGKMV